MIKTRRASALLTMETHPRMMAAVAATVAGCLALLMAFVVGLVGANPAGAAGTTYTVKDLGTLPDGIESYADDVNDSGQVVGASRNPRDDLRAFLYSDGQMKDLGTLPDGIESYARGINDSGQVAGQSHTSTANRIYHAFLYSDGQMQDLGTLGGPYSYAHDVNDSGQVAGLSHTSTGLYHAFVYSDGQMKDLGTLGGSESHASGINDSGQVVGASRFSTSTGAHHAFLYSDGQMKDLGTLGGSESSARGINDSGQVVGGSRTPSDYFHAFLYSDGQMKDLGTLGGPGSIAYGINDSGQVVGSSGTSTDEWSHAFLYSDGQMQDLNDLVPADSGWELTDASAINTSGQIVGEGVVDGNVRAFLATPVPDTVQPQITITTPPQDATYTLGEAVAASYTCTDEDSGMASCEGSVPDGANIDTSSAGTKTFTVNATDNAGNTNSVSHTYTVNPDPNDSTPPTVECGAPDGTWHATDVSIACTASDAGSGLADPSDASFSLSTDVAAGTEDPDVPTGTRKICDTAGNCTDAGPISGNKVDKQAPGIEFHAPAEGATYVLEQAVFADYTCVDGGSDMASCAGTVQHGNSIDTSSVGTKAFQVEATDNVGNQSSRSVSYEVIHNFGGFLSPVDKPSTVNVMKSGSAIPVKFSLGDDYGLDILAEGYPKSGTIPNDPNAAVDNIEVTVSAGSSGLSYDASTEQYTYVWRSSKEWAGTSRQLVLKLEDGTEHIALFRFTR